VAVAVVSILLLALAAWLTVGLAVALWLHAGRLAKLDPGMAGAGLAFRILITPGIMALWPLLLRNVGKAGRGLPAHPDPDRPVPAARLRARHGVWIKAIAVAVPIACAAALVGRPAEPVAAQPIPEPLRTPPLGRVVERREDAFPGYAIATALRSDPSGRAWQLELAIAEVLPLRQPMVYWMPTDGGVASEYVGAIARAGTYRFPVSERMARGGRFAILSFRDATALRPGLKAVNAPASAPEES